MKHPPNKESDVIAVHFMLVFMVAAFANGQRLLGHTEVGAVLARSNLIEAAGPAMFATTAIAFIALAVAFTVRLALFRVSAAFVAGVAGATVLPFWMAACPELSVLDATLHGAASMYAAALLFVCTALPIMAPSLRAAR